MESEKLTQELIRLCIHKHMETKKFPISETKLLKILYKTKMNLPNNHPLRDALPFYWYLHGPYSPYILKLKDKMISEGIISSAGNGFVASATRVVDHIENPSITEARKIINRMIDDSSSTSALTIMDDVYRTFAPTKFYISFKNEFQASLSSFLNDPSTRFKSEQLVDILEKTFGDIPNATLFRNYKYILRDFTELSSHLFKNENFKNYKNELESIVDSIFVTFAKGIRIKFHDEFYENEIEKWTSEFNDSVSELESKINQFALLLKNEKIDTAFVTLDDLATKILTLRSKNKLVMASFLPFTKNDELNDGRIDAQLFDNKTNEELIELIKKFKNSRNAVIHYLKNNDIETENFKLITA